MIFSSKPARRMQRALAGLVCAVALAGLASCGGGTSQFETFAPGRILAFGAETSALTAAMTGTTSCQTGWMSKVATSSRAKT